MTWNWISDSQSAFLDATPPTQVANKKPHEQEKADSCWLNCAKHIINYYRSVNGDANRLTEDSELSSSNAQGSAANILALNGHKNNTDEFRLPPMSDINDAMNLNIPLLVNVGPLSSTVTLSDSADVNAQGGHWMIIVGCDPAANKIAVFDPASGEITTSTWNSKIPQIPLYKDNSYYWQNTSYVDNFSAGSSSSDATASGSAASAGAATASRMVRRTRKSTKSKKPYARQ
jgi:hypothetical protein